MAEFCTKCFSPLNEDGLCPACGHRNIPAAAPAPDVTPIPFVVDEEPVAIPVYVPKFCKHCGTGLNDNGLCPVCDAPAPVPVPKFCIKCGGTLDENGLCPACDAPAPVVDLAAMAQSAVITEDAPAEAAEPNNKGAEKASVLSVIATVLLSVCLFVTMLASVSIIAVRTTVSEGGISSLTENLDVAQLLQSSGVADGDSFDELYHRLERDYGVYLDDDELAELIEDSTIPAYVSQKAGDFSGDFFSGDAELVITKEEMIELIEDNLDLINDAQIKGYDGPRVQPADCEQIADWMFNGDELVLLSTDDLQEQSPALFQAANICLSWVALAFFLLLSALIGFVMCRNSLSQAAIGGGVVFILLGGVAALAAALVMWIPGLWASIAGDSLVLSIVGSLLAVNGLLFAILLAVGILLPVTRTVVKHILKKQA